MRNRGPPGPSSESALTTAGSPLKAGHRKPVWARSGDVYYPTICSLLKITVTDMRSTEHVSVIDTYWI